MADFEIPEEPEYNRNIRRFETTDPAHADLFNAVVQTLIGNDEFLKKVTEQLQQEIEQQHGELTEYTNTKIGQLINGAPETLDTLKEVANAIQENETVVNALDEAIGTKLNKDGDASNTTVTFTSGDSKNPSGYTDVAIIESGEKQSSLWRKVSLFAKNLRYLWKLCGTSDISGVGDGTLTGAVSKLNTDLQNVSGLKFIDFGRYDYNTITVDDCIKDILRRTPVNDQYTYFGRFVRGQEFKVIVQSYPTGDYNSLILFGYASELTYYTKSPGGIAKHEIKCTSMFI